MHRRFSRARYTDAPIFALRWVDPKYVDRSLLHVAPRHPQWGRVAPGDWDHDWESFDERAVPRGLRQRFVAGVPWEETAVLDAFLEQLDRFGNAWAYTSPDGFDQRCREIEHLYERMRDAGYRTQSDLSDRGYETTLRLDEISIDIGRDGRLYWRCCGQHRLAIARLLDLDRVPVIVHRRHVDWQRRRDAVRRDGIEAIDADLRAHPDIAPISAEEREP